VHDDVFEQHLVCFFNSPLGGNRDDLSCHMAMRIACSFSSPQAWALKELPLAGCC
jgi:hypothetical protein